jgi:putative transposase
MARPQGPNQRWSLDFLSDAFADGRRFRILAIVDDFTRECLALVPDTSLDGKPKMQLSGFMESVV